MQKKKKMSFNISVDLHDEIKKVSESLGVTMSMILHMSLRKWLIENTKVIDGK